MATLKYTDIKKMNKKDVEKKLKEMKLELVRAKGDASKKGNSKIRETKKIIARLMTFDNSAEALKNK